MSRGLKGVQETPGRFVFELKPEPRKSRVRNPSARKPSSRKPPPPEVFLCYRHHDENFVDDVRNRLIEAAIPVWMDKSHLEFGDDWQEEIEEALAKSRIVLVFIGPEGIGSFQKLEVAMAFDLQSKSLLKVIPVVLPRVKDAQIPRRLKALHYVDFRRRYDSMDYAVDQLVASILRILGDSRGYGPHEV